MAVGVKLSLTYIDTGSETRTVTFAHADNEAEASDFQAFATAFVTNGSIFTHAPSEIKSMKLVTTTETEIPLS